MDIVDEGSNDVHAKAHPLKGIGVKPLDCGLVAQVAFGLVFIRVGILVGGLQLVEHCIPSLVGRHEHNEHGVLCVDGCAEALLCHLPLLATFLRQVCTTREESVGSEVDAVHVGGVTVLVGKALDAASCGEVGCILAHNILAELRSRLGKLELLVEVVTERGDALQVVNHTIEQGDVVLVLISREGNLLEASCSLCTVEDQVLAVNHLHRIGSRNCDVVTEQRDMVAEELLLYVVAVLYLVALAHSEPLLILCLGEDIVVRNPEGVHLSAVEDICIGISGNRMCVVLVVLGILGNRTEAAVLVPVVLNVVPQRL